MTRRYRFQSRSLFGRAVPKLENRLRGKEAEATGRQFEDRLAAEHAVYELRCRAIIDRLHPPTIMVKGTKGLRTLIGGAPIDFGGQTWEKDGQPARPVWMEAKATADELTSLAFDKNIDPRQLTKLENRRLAGAIVAVCWWRADRLWVLPPAGVKRAADQVITGGRRSIPISEFIELPVGSLDWLTIVQGQGQAPCHS